MNCTFFFSEGAEEEEEESKCEGLGDVWRNCSKRVPMNCVHEQNSKNFNFPSLFPSQMNIDTSK